MNKEITENIYQKLHLIRVFEEKIIQLYPSDAVKSPVHLSIGQEFIAVATLPQLKSSDIVFSNYRGHAHYIAKGGDLKKMAAELFGKKTGCSQGKGGSMHLVDKSAGFMTTSAIVSSSIPNAVGYAQSIKLNNLDDIVVCFFGDGALNEGVYYESLLYAKLFELPIIFICENNGLAIHSKLNARLPYRDLTSVPRSMGIDTDRVCDGSVFSLYDAFAKNLKSCRSSKGPIFLEVICDRYLSHVGPEDDWNLGYRNKNSIKFDDQLTVLEKKLEKSKVKEINLNNIAIVETSFEFALNSEFPSNEDLNKHVF